MAEKTYILKGGEPPNEPPYRRFNVDRLARRSMDELIGLCRGLVADNLLTEEETAFLTRWVQANRGLMQQWPVSVVAARLETILEDKIITPEERSDLFELLQEIIGSPEEAVGDAFSSTLPLTKPAPPVFFTNHRFCFTGRFYFGTRTACEEAVLGRGAKVQSSVTMETHYLVIGRLGNPDWLHSTHGTKIQKALDYQQRGQPVALISEHHWTDHLL